MSNEELVGQSADVVNRYESAMRGFRDGRLLGEPCLHFQGCNLEESLAHLKRVFERKRAYDVGYWYGRITDPRRPWNAAARTT